MGESRDRSIDEVVSKRVCMLQEAAAMLLMDVPCNLLPS